MMSGKPTLITDIFVCCCKSEVARVDVASADWAASDTWGKRLESVTWSGYWRDGSANVWIQAADISTA